MKRHFILSFGVGLAICVLVVSGTFAQTGTTSLRGVVLDKSGATVVGATVKAVDTQEAIERQVSSAENGEYQFLALPPGTYTITAEMPGFRKFEQRNTQLLVNNPTTLNITLEVGSAAQTVEVSAQAHGR